MPLQLRHALLGSSQVTLPRLRGRYHLGYKRPVVAGREGHGGKVEVRVRVHGGRREGKAGSFDGRIREGKSGILEALNQHDPLPAPCLLYDDSPPRPRRTEPVVNHLGCQDAALEH